MAYQHELKGLPELQFNVQVEGDDVWLRMPRLQEIAAPEPDEALRPWVTLPKSPEKTPELKGEIVILDGKREVARERIEDHPEVRELFDWYVENQWEPWAAAERPRRKTIARYNQLFSLQQAISSEGAETPLELAWGIGYAVWKKEGFATPVKYPLLVQPCEVTLNEKTFDLEVRPRDVEPRLEADCYAEMELPGVRQLEAFWRSALATGANRVNPFEASTFDGTLKAAVGHLDPSGAYEVRTDDVTPPTPSDKLKITNTWVLFGRKRSGDIFLEDIRRLKKKVEEATSLPSVIRSFVERGDSTVRVRPEQPFRGLSTSDGGCERDGAVLPDGLQRRAGLHRPEAAHQRRSGCARPAGHGQDPHDCQRHLPLPGPRQASAGHGQGRVRAGRTPGETARADSPAQRRAAVGRARRHEAVRALDPDHRVQRRVDQSDAGCGQHRAAEEKLNQLHAKISHVDRTVAAYASKHMQKCQFQGREVTPEEMAKLVLQDAEAHQWFDDEPPPTKDGKLPFDDAAVSALRRARMKVGEDLVYLGCSLPAPDDFPAWADLLGLHRDLVKAKSIEASVTQGDILALVDSRLETFEKAQALVKFLDDRMALKAKLAGTRQPWLDTLGKRFADMQPGDPVLQALLAVVADVRKLEHQRRELVAKAVDVPADAELNEDFADALDAPRRRQERLRACRSARARRASSLPRSRSPAPHRRPKATGNSCKRPLGWRTEARKVLARWNSLSAEFGLAAPDPGVEAGFKKVALWQADIEDVRQLTFDFDAKLHARLEEVFGKHTADRMWDGGETFVAGAYSSLRRTSTRVASRTR